jgi:HJR/Mrr/RecB family endonuclease/F0F1-type ATP synthase assembly protein I
MTTSSQLSRSLIQLTHEIEQLEAEAARLEAERAAIASDARKAARRLRYLRLAQSIRKPAGQYNLWPMAVMLVGPTMVGVAMLIVVNLLTNSYPAAFIGFLLGTVSGVGLFASLVYHPPDGLLPAAINEAESHARLANARLQEKIERITETKSQLQNLIDERRDQIASGKLQKAALLQRNWKAMRDTEWEDFVVEVCRTLGAKAERTGRGGDNDANLIVDFGPRRVVILTQGEGRNASSATIQQALAAKDRNHCDACAVIINRRFTGAAQDFAHRNGCSAIGTAEFPDFVMGKLDL